MTACCYQNGSGRETVSVMLGRNLKTGRIIASRAGGESRERVRAWRSTFFDTLRVYTWLSFVPSFSMINSALFPNSQTQLLEAPEVAHLYGRSLSHGIERSHQIMTAVRAILGSVRESIFGQEPELAAFPSPVPFLL
jgi:hypothetical protein